MLSLSLPGRVFLCTLPTDMRKSFDTLAALVQTQLGQDPLSGDLFVFRSRRGDRIKLLYWNDDGYAIWYKRLEAGTFQFPFAETGRKEIAAWELGLLLEGIDLSKGQRRKRYSLPETTTLQENQPMDVAQKRS